MLAGIAARALYTGVEDDNRALLDTGDALDGNSYSGKDSSGVALK